MSRSKRLLKIDPTGDLILNVSAAVNASSPPGWLQVSSKCLCLASLVFRAMFAPTSHFKEAVALREATCVPVVVEFYGDDYDALVVVLNILHLRTRNVPTSVTVDALYSIAVVCDKYDTAEALVPWVRVWTASFGNLIDKPGYERWLVISWVFQQSDIFAGVTGKLILETGLELDGRLTTPGCDDVAGVHVPDKVKSAIYAKREEAITSIIDFATSWMNEYTTAARMGVEVCKSKGAKKKHQCDSIAAGGLFRCLVNLGIWPEDKGGKRRSVNRMALMIKAMKSSGSEIIDSARPMAFHTDCGPANMITSKVMAVVGNVEGIKLSDLLSPSDMFVPSELTQPLSCCSIPGRAIGCV